MEIFRGKKPRRGRRAQEHQRQDSRGRKSVAPSPLSELVGEEARATPATGSTRRKPRRDAGRPTVSLGHVAFLLAGLVLGAGILLSVNALLKWRHGVEERVQAATQTPSRAQAALPQASPSPTPAPAPRVRRATAPVEAVRVMLQASYAGDRDTAYAQWEIEPHEVATIVSGQTVTLAEMTTKAAEFGRTVRLESFQFTLRSQAGDQATVVQKRGGTIIQVYSLHRQGPYWAIRFASRS